MKLDRIRETATRAATAAGELLKERLGKIRNVDYKGAFNIVTDVDRASEELILAHLRADFPDFAVVAEESGATSSGPRPQFTWYIDPLDGTTNYTHSYPFFCVSIGLARGSDMVFGIVHNPMAGETFWAEAGGGAWLNGQTIRVSSISTLGASLLATGFPPDTRQSANSNMPQFTRITDLSHGVRRDGAAALDLCFVAAGRLDGFWEMKLSPWDTAAGSLIVRESGGRVSNLEGGPFDMESGHILATNGLIHEETVSVLTSLRAAGRAN